jgi:hypothetical protein
VVYHVTVAPLNEDPRTVYVEKIVAGEKVITIVPPCDLVGIASPSPCVDGQERIQEGDALRIQILMLSGDPKYQG